MRNMNLFAKVAMTLLLAMMTTATAWAENVTSAEALRIAQNFMQNRKVTSSRTRKAPGEMQLTPIRQMNGLYIFNVADDGGYVIVSNDDRTIPVLGYSDSGSIDPNNIPENMKAWLQGYTDEIARLNEQGYTSPPTSARKVQRRSLEHISPLLKTRWGQDQPFNNLCPEYENGKKCATGCVATAMAQVMNYYKYPSSMDVDIPLYNCSNLNISMPILPTIQFDWQNMKEDYSTGYTDDEAQSVATLMQYCGQSVQMNYGPTSEAKTFKVASALKNFFKYYHTTRYVSRSYYSYDNWLNLIYNELAQGRPVIYAGQSTGGGHTFVCDGYSYNNADMVHIVWGWDGFYDGYFVLSVLDPYSQEGGDSPTSSAYNSGHEAIIGIQFEDGGTVLDVPAKTIDLTINDITVSNSTIALGESVDVAFSITNNSTDEYDGELVLSVDGILDISKMFFIPSGVTQDYVITYTPKKSGSMSLRIGYPDGIGGFYLMNKETNLSVLDQTPTGLTACRLTKESATLGWINVGGATKWNLQYRPMTIITEDFNASNSPEGWTSFMLAEGVNAWEKLSNDGIDDSGCFRSDCYGNALATPVINFEGVFSFYAWGEGEHFFVCYTPDDRTVYFFTDEIIATNTPTLYSYSLDEFSGSGRIVILHYTTGNETANSLFIDNVTIVKPHADWTCVNNITAIPYTLSGLSEKTDYEFKVQADINGGGNWSDTTSFTTTNTDVPSSSFALLNDDSSAETKNASLIAAWNGFEANVTLANRTLYKDGAWNTLCLPFDVTIADSPLSGDDVQAMTLNTATSEVSGKKLTLNFDVVSPSGEQGGLIPAGTPFIIKWDNTGETITNPVFSGVTIDNSASTEVSFPGGKFVGTYASTTFENENKSILLLGANNKLFYPVSGARIGAQRAYFSLTPSPSPGGEGSVKEIVLNFGEEEETTGINVNVNTNNDAWYDLSGRKIANGQRPTAKGLYIHNGRKILK